MQNSLSSLCWECVAQWHGVTRLAFVTAFFSYRLYSPHPTGQLLPISQTRKEAPVIHPDVATCLQVGLPFPLPGVIFHTWGAVSLLKKQVLRELTPPSYACQHIY